MQQIICPSCAAEMPPGARYCRRCGQELSLTEPGSVTDATTRLLETPERPRVEFDITREAQPLMKSGETQSIDGLSTKALESPKPQQKWMITSMVLVVLLVIVTAVMLINNRRTPTTVVIPPTVTRPVIPVPPVPALPPLPNGAGGAMGIDPSLIYPGSQTTLTATEGNGHAVTQLHTSDPVGKVADWYMHKLNPTNMMRRPESIIFEVGTLKVIINATGNGTDIFLTEGDD